MRKTWQEIPEYTVFVGRRAVPHQVVCLWVKLVNIAVLLNNPRWDGVQQAVIVTTREGLDFEEYGEVKFQMTQTS
jgi:hypothetical protein